MPSSESAKRSQVLFKNAPWILLFRLNNFLARESVHLLVQAS
jgi:hypothetical protein